MKRQFRWPWRDAAGIRKEVDEEIHFHLDMRMEQLMSEGLDPKEAKEKALQEFGNVDEARRALRDADLRNEHRRRLSEWIREITMDLRYAIRSLAHSRSFTTMAVLTLALGISATTIVFSFMDAVLLQPLPFKNPQQLIHLDGAYSPPDFVDTRNALNGAARIAAVEAESIAMTTDTTSERTDAAFVTPGFFETLEVTPEIGRVITSKDAVSGQDKFAVLSDEIWRNRYAADPGLVGRNIRLEGAPYTVIGIMPAGFSFPAKTKVWLPKSFSTDDMTTQRGARYLDVIGRIEPGTTMREVQRRLSAVIESLRKDHPVTNAKMTGSARDLKESIIGDYRLALLVLMAAGLCLLLIACANIAGLTLVRTLDRAHELALRSALGAGRWRIARTLLTESAVIAVCGGAAGIQLAVWGIAAGFALEAGRIPRLTNVHLDLRSLSFAIGITILSTLFFGLLPIARALQPAQDLKKFRAKSWMQGTFVAAEIALTLVLLTGAGLLLRTFVNLQHVDAGFTIGSALTFDLTLPESKYPKPEQARTFFQEFEERVRRIPGVTAVGSISGLPFTDTSYTISVYKLDGAAVFQQPGSAPFVQLRIATPDYFRTMGLHLVRGRLLENQDREGAPGAVVITEATARLLWPNQEAIGHTIDLGTRLGLGGERVGGTIVGIIQDYHELGLRKASPPMLFVAHAQFPVRYQTLSIQTAGNSKLLLEPIRTELRALDAELPMAQVQEFREIASDALADDRSDAALVGIFAALALILAAIGIYGITAYSVSQRTHEFGIRLALGAAPSQMLAAVLARSLKLVAIGVGVGLSCAVLVTRVLEKMLFALSPTDPLTLFAVSLGFLGVALLASWIPARRAERVDPVSALREERV